MSKTKTTPKGFKHVLFSNIRIALSKHFLILTVDSVAVACVFYYRRFGLVQL